MLNVVTLLARGMALLGGLILTALVLLICVSVLGRGGNTFAHWDVIATGAPGFSAALIDAGIGPVPGDFEIVEAAIAFAIFAFLPLCQLRSAHATVDVFTSSLHRRAKAALQAFWEAALTLAVLLITWRLGAGFIDKIDTGETTMFLGFPTWWAYGASLLAALCASVVALFCAYARVREALTGEAILPRDGTPL